MPHLSSLEWEQNYHELEALYLELEKSFALLKAENRVRREKVNTNSSNSSKLPSQDPCRAKRQKQSSGKKPGGQPGHPGHKRRLYPEENIAAIIDLKSLSCPGCLSKSFNETPVSIECRQIKDIKDNIDIKTERNQCFGLFSQHISSSHQSEPHSLNYLIPPQRVLIFAKARYFP